MSTSSQSNCPRCGTSVDAAALDGLCPRCLALDMFTPEPQPASAPLATPGEHVR